MTNRRGFMGALVASVIAILTGKWLMPHHKVTVTTLDQIYAPLGASPHDVVWAMDWKEWVRQNPDALIERHEVPTWIRVDS